MLHTCALVLLSNIPSVPSVNQHKEIERAVLDYAESYYEARPEYVERSINKGLVKVGFVANDDGAYEPHPMAWEDFMRMVKHFEESGKKPDAGPKEVEILDALDQTALVKLTGAWGTDYMQLAKFDGHWQTRNVIWQTKPKAVDEAQAKADHAAVERAARDYLEALYQAKPELIERSVAQDLTKFGFWRDGESPTYQAAGVMTYERLHALAASWNADGSLPKDAPQEIQVLDVMDKVACAKLTAKWGSDYMHLVKVDGRWMIKQIMWQSHPPTDG
jgi:hypothetical protein